MKIALGVKSDPIESRYTFDWLFGLMSDCGVDRLQYGSSLPTFCAEDEYFRQLRRRAEKKGIRIASLFASQREFGGFASGDPLLEAATRRAWERMIRVATLLGAECAGTNALIVMRDLPRMKESGIRRFMENIKALLAIAKRAGLKALTTEPMSSVWEYPSTPEEVTQLATDLGAFHAANPASTVPFYYCTDVTHGVVDENRCVVHSNWELLEVAIPFTWEIHFKNTDAALNSTFGFGPEDVKRGIVDLGRLADLLKRNALRFPLAEITGYLEIPGPKVGRDYSDPLLGRMLMESLEALKRHFPSPLS
jgi:hypothetical protein